MTFSPLTLGKVTGTTAVEVPGLARGTTYYWKVVARNAGGASPWSAVWHFGTTSAELPRAPVLTAPANGAAGVPQPVRLSWQAVAGAAEYGVQVSTVETCATVIVTKGLTGTSLELPPLVAGTTYFWRVLAKNVAGYSPFSPVWRFTTVACERPAAPVLYAPANGAVDVPTAARLIWLAAARATGYLVQVSTTTDFAKVAWTGTASGSSTAAEPQGLLARTTYFWRVKAMNSGGASDWSAIWRFTTKSPDPPTGS